MILRILSHHQPQAPGPWGSVFHSILSGRNFFNMHTFPGDKKKILVNNKSWNLKKAVRSCTVSNLKPIVWNFLPLQTILAAANAFNSFWRSPKTNRFCNFPPASGPASCLHPLASSLGSVKVEACTTGGKVGWSPSENVLSFKILNLQFYGVFELFWCIFSSFLPFLYKFVSIWWVLMI